MRVGGVDPGVTVPVLASKAPLFCPKLVNRDRHDTVYHSYRHKLDILDDRGGSHLLDSVRDPICHLVGVHVARRVIDRIVNYLLSLFLDVILKSFHWLPLVELVGVALTVRLDLGELFV